MKVVKRLNPSSSQHREKKTISLVLYLYEMMDVN